MEEKETPVAEGSAEETVAGGKPHENIAKRKRMIRDMCYIALFTALIVVCTYIAFPIGTIPVTLQTLAVCMAGGFLGWKRGTLSVIVYILLGVCGIPVFSGFHNFYALIIGPTTGYVVGFIFTALIVGFTSDNLHKIGDRAKNKTAGQIFELILLAVAMVVGIAVCYLFGTLWFTPIAYGSVTAANLQKTLTVCVYPFIVVDLVKIVIAAFLVNRLKRFVK